MKTRVIILGGIGTAVNLAECIVEANKKYNMDVEFLGFAFDDEEFGDVINGFPVLCKTYEVYEKYGHSKDVKFIFQIFRQDKMKERAELINSFKIPLSKWYTFIHPLTYVAESAKIGYGTVIFPGCSVFSNSVIGDFCTFCSLTTVGHNTVIDNYVFTATHVCIGSYVRLKKYIFLAQNTTIIGSISINENNLIGLGSNVVDDIHEEQMIFIGSPAKPFKPI